MTACELIERLSGLVKEQADIIRVQAEALAQLGAAAAEEQTAAAGEGGKTVEDVITREV